MTGFGDAPFSPERDLSVLQQKLLDWMIVPADLREPASEAGFARMNDVSVAAVFKAARDPRFRSVLRQANSLNDMDGYQHERILDTLYAAGQDGNVRAAEAWLKHSAGSGRLSVASDLPLDELTDEQLAALIESID